MLRSELPVATALALAVFAPLVAPDLAMAQQQGSWYSGTDGYGRSTSGWSRGYGGGSYATATEVKGPRAAQIDVRLPAGATIWFDDNPTSQAGVIRHFESPPLDLDTDYFYRVTVRWHEGGQEITSTRKVKVHAGDRLNLTFGPSVAEAARR